MVIQRSAALVCAQERDKCVCQISHYNSSIPLRSASSIQLVENSVVFADGSGAMVGCQLEIMLPPLLLAPGDALRDQLDICLVGMRPAEVCDFSLSNGAHFRLQLLSLSKAAAVWRMTAQERLTTAVQFKERGNAFYAGNELCRARLCYQRCLTYVLLPGDSKAASEQQEALDGLVDCQLAALLNLAACQVRRAPTLRGH